MHGWNWKTRCDLHCECQLQPSLTQSHPVSPSLTSSVITGMSTNSCFRCSSTKVSWQRHEIEPLFLHSPVSFCAQMSYRAICSKHVELEWNSLSVQCSKKCAQSAFHFQSSQGLKVQAKRVLLASSITDRTTHLHWTQELEVKFIARMLNMAPTHQSGCMTDVPMQGFI